jgi:thiamine-phosphate pyrophosphorylase
MIDLTSRRGLYAIVDPEFCASRNPLDVADAILQGGCAVLQLRAKRLHELEVEALAFALRARCHAAFVPFVVNDYASLARSVGADGLHLGQGDISVAQARAIVGADMAIGVSTHGIEQARLARAAGADLIGFGPVFATTTKHDPDPVVGFDGLREVCAQGLLPVVAIGGITLERAAEVVAAGAQMAAAIAAVCGAADPCAAAQRLHRALGG